MAYFPEALDLLEELKPKFLLACLSNNNELHWAPLREMVGLVEKFHYCFISHEIGIMKPNRKAFDYVLGKIKKPANEVVFFDDSQECVEAAKAIGMAAYWVHGVGDVRSVLQNFNIAV